MLVYESAIDLKSSLDRFIAATQAMSPITNIIFKIQFG